jgi:osmotically-inducible protein OsmY
MKRFALLTLITLALAGCIESAFVAGAATGSAVVYDRRPLQTIVTDQNIYHDATIRLMQDKTINEQCHIVVSTFNRVLLVIGQAPNTYCRDHAIEIIKQVPNIKRIYNEIEIANNTPALVRSSDTWITAKVKTELLLTKDFRSGQIKVVTENGTVYLLGLVTNEQANGAVAVARQVAGVQRVVKLFEYVHAVD